jgi:putative sterol carrier protein
MADEQSEVTPDQVFEQMPAFFDAQKAGNTTGTVQFDLSGAHPGKWFLKIADGKAESGKGEVEKPNLTMSADSQDWVKISLGKMDPTSAFMSGKLKIKGDMGLAMKMATLFRRPS